MSDRILSRRQALALIGASGAALLAATRPAGAALPIAPPSCVARPQQTEGPFFVDEELNRSDLRSDPRTGALRPGVSLQLTFRISRMTGASCAPLAGAQVDLWHCDAAGRYSDTSARGRSSADAEKFLRGYQRTDAAGTARFLTIYPGGYGGRTVHLHFKVRGFAQAGSAREFTSQLYFDDGLTDVVHAAAPYAAGRRRSMRNSDDFLFRDGGRQLLLDPVKEGEGYAATFDLGLQIA
ncbi:MAG: intradiol ring-cleavage dioxygenase [Pseudomonadota bacterium]|nr:intradiol ring-cleavage dioxygenase [Pseudomonadota bacterium]